MTAFNVLNTQSQADVIDELLRVAALSDGAGVSIYGQKEVSIVTHAAATDTAVAQGLVPFCVPTSMNGMNLVSATAANMVAGITGQTDVQVRKVRAGVASDMLDTKIVIPTTEFTNTSVDVDVDEDDIATGDLILIDVDVVTTTEAIGMAVTLTFATP